MPRFIPISLLAIAVWFAGSVSLRGDWPARVFAPYMYVGSGDHFQLTQCDDACGQKFYTLAFVIAGKDGLPAWDGRTPMDQDYYLDQIRAIRARSGDVIVSFGGEAGREIALVATDPLVLEKEYSGVVERYQLTWLDFDIEGHALSDKAANRRRNLALKQLQASHPGLRVSFTLPVDPDGISDEARELLADAHAQGLRVYSANVMTMDYGSHFSAGRKMSDVGIDSAKAAYKQCQAIDPTLLIGLTPMTGQNDEKSEVFTLDDAQSFETWAAHQPWVCSLSFWSINRDAGKSGKSTGNTSSGVKQRAWAFTRAFQSFQGKRPLL